MLSKEFTINFNAICWKVEYWLYNLQFPVKIRKFSSAIANLSIKDTCLFHYILTFLACELKQLILFDHIIFPWMNNEWGELDSPVLEMMEIDPSELPQASRSPNSWGAKFTEFTEKLSKACHVYSFIIIQKW